MEVQNQNQIIEIKIKKPVKEIEIINIDPWKYNALRSFVESSDRETYEWNQGIKERNFVIFEKERKWKLKIRVKHELSELEINGEIRPIFAEFTDIQDYLIFWISYNAKNESWHLENIGDGFEINSDLRNKAVISNVPYARLIRLSEIVAKLCRFADFPFCP